MGAFYVIMAILNGVIGIYFIQRGIKKYGKEKFLKESGYYYIGWVAVSTIIIMIKGTI